MFFFKTINQPALCTNICFSKCSLVRNIFPHLLQVIGCVTCCDISAIFFFGMLRAAWRLEPLNAACRFEPRKALRLDPVSAAWRLDPIPPGLGLDPESAALRLDPVRASCRLDCRELAGLGWDEFISNCFHQLFVTGLSETKWKTIQTSSEIIIMRNTYLKNLRN